MKMIIEILMCSVGRPRLPWSPAWFQWYRKWCNSLRIRSYDLTHIRRIYRINETNFTTASTTAKIRLCLDAIEGQRLEANNVYAWKSIRDGNEWWRTTACVADELNILDEISEEFFRFRFHNIYRLILKSDFFYLVRMVPNEHLPCEFKENWIHLTNTLNMGNAVWKPSLNPSLSLN